MVSVYYVHTSTGRNVTHWGTGQIVLTGPVVNVILICKHLSISSITVLADWLNIIFISESLDIC